LFPRCVMAAPTRIDKKWFGDDLNSKQREHPVVKSFLPIASI